MLLSWGSWCTGQNVVLKFTCSSNGSLLTWYRRQVFLLKSVRICAFPCQVWWEFMMGDVWEEMSDSPASQSCTGGSKTNQKGDYFEIINYLSLDWFSCCTKPILNTYLQTFRHFTEGKNPPRRNQHIHSYICGLKIPKEAWHNPICWPWVLPFCAGVNPARCSMPLIQAEDICHLVWCSAPSPAQAFCTVFV